MMNTMERHEKARVLMRPNCSTLLERDSQLVAAISLNTKTMGYTSTSIAVDESLDVSSSSKDLLKEQPESAPDSGPPLVASNGSKEPSVTPKSNMDMEPPTAGQNKKRKSLSDDDENSTDSSISSSLDVSDKRRDRSDAGKKPRFRGDICTKQGRTSHGSWKTEELSLFLLGLQMYGKDWNQVAALVKSRSYIQVRSHAQYYFAKIEAKEAALRRGGEDTNADRLQFTTEEEKQFMNAIQIYGDDYLMIPKIAPLIPSRTAANVREHLRVYRLDQKQRLKEEIRQQQVTEEPPAESSDKNEPTLSRESSTYSLVSPPCTAPYTNHQTPRTGAYATSTDIFAAQALAKARSERSRLVKEEDARRLHYSQLQAVVRNAATLRNNSTAGRALPVTHNAVYAPTPGDGVPARVATTYPPPGTSTPSIGINNGVPAAAQRGRLALSLPVADNLTSSMELHFRNLRQNENCLASNRYDDEPMDNHNDNQNCVIDVDEGAETEVEESDSSSAQKEDSNCRSDDVENDDDKHSSAKKEDSDSSSDDVENDYSSSFPPFLEQVPNIPCSKTYIHDLLGKGTWKSEVVEGVTILSPLSL